MSLNGETNGRAHVHAYWHTESNNSNHKVFCGTPAAWAFMGWKPVLRTNFAKGGQFEKAAHRGHYYCQCNKTGTVISKTNFTKYVDFVVEQKWVIGLWQRRKLDHKTAKTEIIAARGHTFSYLKEIQYVESMEEKIAIEQEKAVIDAMIQGSLKPYKWIPDVALWKLQYEKDHPMGIWGKSSRFKFLVLTGPSSMGKTMFAKALFGVDATFVCQCQNVTKPDLQDFVRAQHEAIVFDELTSTTLVENKQIFQANSDVALLGQSPTGGHIYRRFLYGTAIIVSTNTWMQGIKRGSSEEEWLLSNAIVYDCTEKLWIQ